LNDSYNNDYNYTLNSDATGKGIMNILRTPAIKKKNDSNSG